MAGEVECRHVLAGVALLYSAREYSKGRENMVGGQENVGIDKKERNRAG